LANSANDMSSPRRCSKARSNATCSATCAPRAAAASCRGERSGSLPRVSG
jgi:hypothetical protein